MTGPAVIWEWDGGETRELTFTELATGVRRAATGFRASGSRSVTSSPCTCPWSLKQSSRCGRRPSRRHRRAGLLGLRSRPLAERLPLGGARVLVTADGTSGGAGGS